MIFREIARPSPVPVRRVVKYGSNTRGRSSGGNADAAIADLDGDAAPRRVGRSTTRIAAGWRRRPARASDRVPGVGQDVDQRQPQPLGVGDDRRQRRRRGRACTATAGRSVADAPGRRRRTAR